MSADFLAFFLDEAVDILAGWEKSCLELEQTNDLAAVESLYRGAHNLKSGGAAVGLRELSQFVHHIEDLLARLAAGKIITSPALIRLFLDVQTILTTWIAQLRQNPKYVPNSEHLRIDDQLYAATAAAADGPASPGAAPSDDVAVEPDALAKVFGQGAAAPAAEPLASGGLVVPAAEFPDSALVAASTASPDSALGGIDAAAPVAANIAKSNAALDLGAAAPAAATTAKPEAAPGGISALAPAAKPDAAPSGVGAASTHAAQARQAESVRVAAHKLDMLIQLVGELSTQQAIVWHARQNGALGAKSSDHAIQLIQKNAKELQSLALSLRMQALDTLFQRLERTARDLARRQGKKIEVIADGAHVELDRAVIERITEALTHVIRNGVDHGIEDPIGRLDSGKAQCATLRLSGSQEPGGILITISDDGRGLNLEKIHKKALEKGLARPGEAYTNAEIQRFIFASGFSTADQVTDVSGRGVGMDVVKNAVQSIGGSITVSSTPGRGSVFAISLPTTLSIVDAMIVEADGCRYAVPVQDVSEIIDLSSFKLERAGTRGHVLSLRNAVVPVERLLDHLPPQLHPQRPRTSAAAAPINSIRPALLVRTGAGVLAFQIDRITGQQPVSLRPLPGGLDRIPGYTGGSILGDGDACIILNLPALVRRRGERLSADSSEGEVDLAELGAAGEGARPELESRHLIINLHGRTLATPLHQVREILDARRVAALLQGSEHVAGCIEVRGRLLKVVALASILGLPTAPQPGGPVVVFEVDGTTFAVAVDRVEAVANIALIPAPQLAGSKSAAIPPPHAAAHFGEQLIAVIDMHLVRQKLAGGGIPQTPNLSDAPGTRMEAS